MLAQTLRTADGHPDLQGTWSSATLTPLERPARFAGKPTLSGEEARQYEQNAQNPFDEDPDLTGEALQRVKEGNAIGAGSSEAWEAGTELARVDGLKRTSLIVDPADGKIPALTPEAKRRAAARRERHDHPSGVGDFSLKERCLVYSTVPIIPLVYNNNYQIVQTPTHVMILGEMIHDARIVRMNAEHLPPSVRLWLGDSIGWWEGDTLVIDTTNFNNGGEFRGSTENLHVVERLSRSTGSILYRATIDDPATFTKPWVIEYPLIASTDRIYEYACHEGDSWVESRLAQSKERDQAPKAK